MSKRRGIFRRSHPQTHHEPQKEVDAEKILKDAGAYKPKSQIAPPEHIDFLMTYWWALVVIVIGLGFFVWWQFFSIDNEICSFAEGTGVLCQKFDATNESITIEVRNLNNKSITLNKVSINACSIAQDTAISANDQVRIAIPCNVSSGKLKEKIILEYTIEDFKKTVVGNLVKIVP